MKIWKAELKLVRDDNNEYIVKFIFSQEEYEYKVNEKYNEWIYSRDFYCDRIPIEMKIENDSYNLSIIQGFDHELNVEELKTLKLEMKKFMITYLHDENEVISFIYDKKHKAILFMEED